MIHPDALKLILEAESFAPHPMWPGGASGVTWGYGWDAGYHSLAELNADWLDPGRLICPDLASQHAILQVVGKKGAAAWSAITPAVKACFCSKIDAMIVFEECSIPKYEMRTAVAFPGVEDLPAEVRGALVSLVFNRGASMGEEDTPSWDQRREMREIREAVKAKNLPAIADALRSMKRIWAGKNLGGLLVRRDAEADLVERAIA
jgi:hypothetical protein